MKTRRIFELASVAMATAVAVAISAPLYAAPDTPAADQPNPAFQKLDTSHDGYISRDEAAKLRNFGKAFNEADDNRDGKLDEDEFVKAQSVYDPVRARAYTSA